MALPVIQMIPIKNLVLSDSNPRTVTREGMDKIIKSISEDPDFLNNRPILVHEEEGVFTVYAGNQRVRAAKKLKWKEIPCIVNSNLTKDVVKSRIIKDNLHVGEFDYEILANEFDITLLLESGFDLEDLDLSLENENKKETEEKERCESCGHKIKKKKNG